MTKKTKTAPKAKRAKQTEIPGTERKKIEAIEEAADELLEERDAKKRAGDRIKDLEASISTLVAEHGLKKYVYTSGDGDEFTVRAESKTKVTVKRTKKAKAKDAE